MSDMDEFMNMVGQNAGPREVAGHAQHPTVRGEAVNADWAKLLASASCWAKSGEAFFPVNSVVDSLPPGVYRTHVSQQGPFVQQLKLNTDDLIHLPDSGAEKLLEEFRQFWTLKPSFDKRGFTFKRGMLMWGPPGSGKTSAIKQMADNIINKQNGVVMIVEDPSMTVWFLGMLRRIEPNRPVVTVAEDMDSIIRNHGDHGLLAMLDGEFQINNVVHIATTNYPQHIDRRFIDRPSRFDTIMKINMPTAPARRLFLQHKEPDLDERTLTRWVERTVGYSVAHLKEVCIATQCFGQDEDSVFERLDKMRQPISVDEEGELRNRVGFR